MKLLKKITASSIIFSLISICGFLFVNLFVASQVQGSEIQIQLNNPPNGSILSGNISASAQTNTAVTKVEFYFLEESGRFTFTYNGTNIGSNNWQYTWNTDESIDGVYRVHAIAVDGNNSTYISNINLIHVDNAGNSAPSLDQNTNSTPISNYNVNENPNINTNSVLINFNTNSNFIDNTNTINTNTQLPINENNNTNYNTNSEISGNENLNINSGTGRTENPDDDNDGLTNEEEAEIGTDTKNPDTDNDGLIDGFEKKHGFNPVIDDNNTPANIPDQDIIKSITDAKFGVESSAKDTDLDGIPDSVEITYGTDPYDPDTSNDGLTDGFKAFNGYPLTADNSGHISKKKIDLPNPDIESQEQGSALPTIAIFSTLVLIIVIVLIVFRPKKGVL